MNFLSRPLLALAAFGILSGCGLIKAPFRVAEGLTTHAYQGGKKVVDKSSAALEKRKERKEKEKAVEAAQAAKAAGGENPVPTQTIPMEGPAIPLPEPTGPAVIPTEPALPVD